MVKRFSIILAIVALVAMATASVASAKVGGTDRPFQAELEGTVTFEFGAPGAEPCGPYQPGWEVSVITHTEAAGTAAHMGKTQASFWHCPTDIGHDNGHLTLTAANGDEVIFRYADDGSHPGSFPMEIVGGTGRFEDATGSTTIHYGLAPALTPDGDPDFFTPWGWWATIDGTISY